MSVLKREMDEEALNRKLEAIESAIKTFLREELDHISSRFDNLDRRLAVLEGSNRDIQKTLESFSREEAA